jgi:Bacterial conjugation TrbI-like protein
MDTFKNQITNATPTLPDMAELMGLDLEVDDPASSVSRLMPAEKDTEESPENFASAELVAEGIPVKKQEADIINDAEFNPEKNRTKVSFQHNGIAKTLLVGGAGLAVIVGGMSFFQGQLPKQQVAQVVKKKDPADDKVTTAQAALTKAQQSESETKAQLALAKQKDSLTQAQQPDQSKSEQSEPITIAKASLETTPPVVVVPKATANNFTPVNVTPVSVAPVAAPVPVRTRPRTIAPVQPFVAPVRSLVAAPVARPIAQPSPIVTRQPARQEIQVAANKSSLKSLKPIATPGLGVPIITYGNPDDRTKNININSQPSDPYAELQQLAAVGRFGAVSSGVEVAPPPSLNPGNNLRSNIPSAPVSLAVANSLPPLSQYFQNFTGQESEVNTSKQNSSSESTGTRTAYANQRAIMGSKSVDKEPAKETVVTQSTPTATLETTIKDRELAAESSPKLTAANALTAFVTKNQQAINTSLTESITDSDTQKPLLSTSPIKVAETPLMIRTLLVGTSAKGSTLTPVLWGSGTSNTARFLLKLDEPMLDGNNKEAFPAGTQFVVTAKPANNSIGLAELEVVSTIIKGMEFAAPSGSIVIRDDQGGLLIGEDYFKRNENIASRDMWSIFTGALGGVGRILNQPTSTVSSSINGGVFNNSNVVTNRDPNILGAVLEGGFRDLSGVLSQRNQQAIQELAGRPNIYQIPKGRGIRVFVNQSMTF